VTLIGKMAVETMSVMRREGVGESALINFKWLTWGDENHAQNLNQISILLWDVILAGTKITCVFLDKSEGEHGAAGVYHFASVYIVPPIFKRS